MAVESTTELVSQVRDEWQVDATDAQILAALNTRHRRMVARSRCFRKEVALGPTVAGQDAYALPAELVELYLLTVNGTPWGPARFEDFAALKAGDCGLQLRGPGGVFVQDATAGGGEQARLYPAPDTAGQPITAWAAVRAPELALTPAVVSPVIPAEFFEQLVAGAASILIRRFDTRFDLADSLDGQFDAACEELRRQVERRYGPRLKQIPVRWP